MERRATAEMSFINGSLSEKTVGGNNKMRERDASFSPYLESSHPDHQQHYLGRCTIANDSAELSIFDAKKYFNEVTANNINRVSPITNMEQISENCVDHPSSGMVSRFSPVSSSVEGYRNCKARSFHAATPTASSEASWNSQTGLLSNPPGAISVSVLRDPDQLQMKTRRLHKSSSSASAARRILRSSKCPCTGKKSVQVQESKVISDPKTSPPYLNNSHSKPLPPPQSQPQPQSLPDMVNISNISVGENTTTLNSDNDIVWSQRRFLDQQVMANTNPSAKVRFPPNLLLQGQTTQRIMASGRPFSAHQNISCTLPASGFTFPILKNNANNNGNKGDLPVRLHSTTTNGVLMEDPPRDSLEVFKPSSARDCGNQVVSLTLRGSPKSPILATAAASGATIIGDVDDVASDASSDLFEIESFSIQTVSTTTYPVMYHRRDSLEEARRLAIRRSLDEPMTPSSIAPTDWYEPSEASIDWSVTTAEGFDRASVTNMSVTASEADDLSAMMRRGEAAERSSGGGGGNNNSRRRSSSGNGLLSCRSEKAVSVGPHPVKFITNVADRDRSNGPPRAVNNAMKHVGSRPPLGNKPPLARSHSARLSLTFAA